MYSIRQFISTLKQFEVAVHSKQNDKKHILSKQGKETVLWGSPDYKLQQPYFDKELDKIERFFSIDKNDFLEKIKNN